MKNRVERCGLNANKGAHGQPLTLGCGLPFVLPGMGLERDLECMECILNLLVGSQILSPGAPWKEL